MSEQLLLDTCAVVWIANEQPIARHSLQTMNEARAAGEPIFVSPITAWEVGQLVSRGRLSISMPPDRWFMEFVQAPGIQLADMPPRVLVASSFLPGRSLRDPADRVLAATAREFGYRLVTRDRPLLDYSEQGHMLALAC